MPIVVTATSPAVTVEEAKAYLQIDARDTTLDALVEQWIAVAEDLVARRVGPLTLTTVVEDVTPSGGIAVLSQMPVRSLTTVTSGGVALTSVTADLLAGLVHLRAAATVEYVAGFETLPARVREVILELVRLRHESRPDGLPAGVEVAEEDRPLVFPTSDEAILARLDTDRRVPSIG